MLAIIADTTNKAIILPRYASPRRTNSADEGRQTTPYDLHLTEDERKKLGDTDHIFKLVVALRYSWPLPGVLGAGNGNEAFVRAANEVSHDRPGILGGTWPWHLTGELGHGLNAAHNDRADPTFTLKLEFAPFTLSGGTPAKESTTHEGKTPGLKSVDEIAATLANSGRRNIVGVAMQRLENGKQGDVMLYDGI